jgi:hypothetical protein
LPALDAAEHALLKDAPVTRKRCLEMLALAAAAAASFATSAPPPDWTQEDRSPPQALVLLPGEELTLSVYAEGPPSFGFALGLESDERPPVTITITADGASTSCAVATFGVDFAWPEKPTGEPALYRNVYNVPKACFPENAAGGGLTIKFRAPPLAFSASEPPPYQLNVVAIASASGDDDEPQEPPSRVELR